MWRSHHARRQDRGEGLLLATASVAFAVICAGAALAASTDFLEPASSPETAGMTPVAVAAADLDGDADADLAVATLGSDDVTILKNNGAGNFFEPTPSPEPAAESRRPWRRPTSTAVTPTWISWSETRRRTI